MTIGTECCLCIMELNVVGIIGIEVELPASELELNCLGDFVPESEKNWNCFYWNWITKMELTQALLFIPVIIPL